MLSLLSCTFLFLCTYYSFIFHIILRTICVCFFVVFFLVVIFFVVREVFRKADVFIRIKIICKIRCTLITPGATQGNLRLTNENTTDEILPSG